MSLGVEGRFGCCGVRGAVAWGVPGLEREKSGAGLGSYVRDTLWQPAPAIKPQKITETISKVEAKKIPANGKLIVNIFRNILITYIGVCSKAPASSSMWLFQIKKN